MTQQFKKGDKVRLIAPDTTDRSNGRHAGDIFIVERQNQFGREAIHLFGESTVLFPEQVELIEEPKASPKAHLREATVVTRTVVLELSEADARVLMHDLQGTGTTRLMAIHNAIKATLP